MNPEQLLDDLIRTTNVSVLQGICLRLQVDYEGLAGLTLNAKARSLVDRLRENGRLADLAAELITLQPQLANKYELTSRRRSWIDDVAAGENPLEDTMITMQWQDGAAAPDDDPWIHERTTITRRQADEAITTNLAVPENPYEPTRPTYQPEMFFGRVTERERIWDNLKQGQSMALVGPAKIGKSSLLYMLTRPEQATLPHVTAYLDLQVRIYANLKELLNAAFGQWIRQIGSTSNIPYLDDMKEFARWVKALNQKGLKPILCLDGVEALFTEPLAVDEDEFAVWHALASEGQLTFLTAAQRPFSTLLQQHNRTTPFPTLFQRLDLGLFEETAVIDLLKTPIEKANLAPPAGLLEQLQQLCGPHPFYLQLAGFHLFAGLAIQSYSWANLRQTIITQATPHWETLWEKLTVGQQETLRALAQPEQTSPISARSIRALTTKGMVVENNGQHHLFSQGFADWLRQTYPITTDEPKTAVLPIEIKEQSWLDKLFRRPSK